MKEQIKDNWYTLRYGHGSSLSVIIGGALWFAAVFFCVVAFGHYVRMEDGQAEQPQAEYRHPQNNGTAYPDEGYPEEPGMMHRR